MARIARLSDGTTVSVPHDGVIENGGDFATLAAAAAALGSGAVVRAEGRAVQEGASLRAIEIRFEDEDEDGEEDDEEEDDDEEGVDSGDDGDSDDRSGDESEDEGDGSDDDALEDDSADG